MATKAKKKKITINYQTEPGVEVYVAGSFNDWALKDKKKVKKMKESADTPGSYSISMFLASGEYEYKIYHDNSWHLDPNAESNKQNVFGTFNSIITVQG